MAAHLQDVPPPRALPASSARWRWLAVLAAGSFALVLARPGGLAHPFAAHVLADADLGAADQARWLTLGALPGILVPFLALLSDAVGLGGARRRSWLLAAAGAGVLLWPLLAAAGSFAALLVAQLALALAMALFLGAHMGLAADVGQETGLPGAAGGVMVAANHAGVLALVGVAPLLRDRPQIWSAVAAALVLAAFGVAAWCFLRPEPRPPGTVARPREAFPALLSARSFWLSALLLFALGLANQSGDVYLRLRAHWGGGFAGLPAPSGWAAAGVLLGGLAYLWLCRRCALRPLLVAAVGATAGATALIFAAGSWPGAWVADGRALLLGLTSLPVIHLTLRVAPPGLEALGLALLQLASAAGFALGTMVTALLFPTRPATALAVLLAVSLAALGPLLFLPAALARSRDGEPAAGA